MHEVICEDNSHCWDAMQPSSEESHKSIEREFTGWDLDRKGGLHLILFHPVVYRDPMRCNKAQLLAPQVSTLCKLAWIFGQKQFALVNALGHVTCLTLWQGDNFWWFLSCWELLFATNLAGGDSLGWSGPKYVGSGIKVIQRWQRTRRITIIK